MAIRLPIICTASHGIHTDKALIGGKYNELRSPIRQLLLSLIRHIQPKASSVNCLYASTYARPHFFQAPFSIPRASLRHFSMNDLYHIALLLMSAFYIAKHSSHRKVGDMRIAANFHIILSATNRLSFKYFRILLYCRTDRRIENRRKAHSLRRAR